ncbi:MAG TPA: GNAT family N-acetyltransferase [Candidatus Binatia bacterium]|nr:GNAT family N-acetyltransferase [Candidatus Binatia bacterium]
MTREPEPEAVAIRRARASDLASIVGLYAEDAIGATRERPGSPLPEAYARAFAEIDRDPSHALVVAELAGEVVGTLQLTLLPNLTFEGGKRALVEAVHVAARHRGRRIGEELMRWAIERARAAGCRLVQLTTDARRTDAKRFYERLGFVPSHVGMKLHLDR